MTTVQAVSVTVAVSGGTGTATATGTVILSGGSIQSASHDTQQWQRDHQHSAGKLARDRHAHSQLHARYEWFRVFTPAPAVMAPVIVSAVMPTVTVTPGASSITTTQPLTVTVAVNGGTGNPTATGTVTLSGGSYTSAATALSSGTATINIPAGTLSKGNYTFTATYTPDTIVPRSMPALRGRHRRQLR